MKATITAYYCDRCNAEDTEKVPAAHKVWIRTTLGGRTLRQDVCDTHLAMLVGSNGAAPPATRKTPTERVWARNCQLQATYARLKPFITKNTRFSLDDVRSYVGKEVSKVQLGLVMRLLVEDGHAERYAQGIYQRPGVTIPEPETVEGAAAAVLKIVKARPGVRGVLAAAYTGIATQKMWRATLAYLRERKLARTKGRKSATRLYAR